jgi:hypothetical protein
MSKEAAISSGAPLVPEPAADGAAPLTLTSFLTKRRTSRGTGSKGTKKPPWYTRLWRPLRPKPRHKT